MDHLAALDNLLQIQQAMADVHPLLCSIYPVALVEDSRMRIYDVLPPNTSYSLVGEMAGPDALPDGFLAEIELPAYPGHRTRVLAPETLDTPAGRARLMASSVHCGLVESYQDRALSHLNLEHPDSPYELMAFDTTHDTAWLYRTLISALEGEASQERIGRLRNEILGLCGEDMWAMVVLNEWREGLPRYVENQVRSRTGLQPIAADLEPGNPFTPPDEHRTVNGGAALIAWLEARSLGLCHRPLELLDTMLAIGADRDAQPASNACR